MIITERCTGCSAIWRITTNDSLNRFKPSGVRLVYMPRNAPDACPKCDELSAHLAEQAINHLQAAS